MSKEMAIEEIDKAKKMVNDALFQEKSLTQGEMVELVFSLSSVKYLLSRLEVNDEKKETQKDFIREI